MREARDYLACCEERYLEPLDPFARLHFSVESTRLRARLVEVMAWLFVRKGVVTGELTAAEARGECVHMLRHEACLAQMGPDGSPDGSVTRTFGTLPRGLLSLVERSCRLDVRLARLKELIARNAA